MLQVVQINGIVDDALLVALVISDFEFDGKHELSITGSEAF
jgi:hypothetical protein